MPETVITALVVLPVLLGIAVFSFLFNMFFLREKRRDRHFKNMTLKYRFTVQLPYKDYPFWQRAWPEQEWTLRILKGNIKGKSIIIQDKLQYQLTAFSQPWSWNMLYFGPLFYLYAGADIIFRYTEITVNGEKKSFTKTPWLLLFPARSEIQGGSLSFATIDYIHHRDIDNFLRTL